MQQNDKLDELFACKLGNMEVMPPEDGWIRIENELNRRNRMSKRLWMAAASFALVLSVTASMFYMQTKRNIVIDNAPSISSVENTSQQSKEVASSIMEEMPPSTGNNVEHLYNGITAKVINSIVPAGSIAINDEVAIEIPEFITETEIDETTQMLPEITENIEIQAISDNIAQTNTDILPDNKPEVLIAVATPLRTFYDDDVMFDLSNTLAKSQPRNRWEIAGQFAPMQSYRAVSNVPAGLRKSDFDNAESPLQVYSSGVSVAYKLYNKLSVQIGVLYSQMGQSINNVIPATVTYAAVSSNNAYTKNFVRTSSGSVSVASNLKSDSNNTYSSYFNAESQIAKDVPNYGKYRLMERLDYLEIPLMLRYKFIDQRRISFHVLSGMSANVLLETNVFVDNGSEIVKGGNILMARPLNYSSTFGLGIGYQITKNMLVNLEPAFKYFLQSYTTSSQIGSNPYAFGLFTNAVYCF